MRYSLFFILFLVNALTIHAASLDSLRLETRNGKQFIVHRVEQGETLYALSRKYNVSVDDITSANASDLSAISIGQLIFVPVIKKAPHTPVPQGAVVHIVKEKETMYSISRTYQVEIEKIREWNQMDDNSLEIGQELFIYPAKEEVEVVETAAVVAVTTADSTLAAVSDSVQEETADPYEGKKVHVVESGETLFSIARQYQVTVEQITAWNLLQKKNLSPGQKLIVGDRGGIEEPTSGKLIPINTTSENTSYSNEKVIESGMAEVIEGTSDTRKYLALHRTAPVGTIMQVKNEMNGLTVFVRVLGQLPDTQDNNGLILKISEKAFRKLGGVNNRFRVIVSYAP